MKYRDAFELSYNEYRPSTVPAILRRVAAEKSYFSAKECEELDALVTRKSPGVDALTDGQLQCLRSSLDDIAAAFVRAEGWPKNATLKQQEKKAERVKKLCDKLLADLLFDQGSDQEKILDPDAFDLNLIDHNGIFERSGLHIGKLIAAVKIIGEHAVGTIEGIRKKTGSDDPPSDERGRKLDFRRLWLYHNMAELYKIYWGSGAVPISRSNDKGGPSVRYFQFVEKKLTGRSPSMDSVFDFVTKYVDRSDPSKVYF